MVGLLKFNIIDKIPFSVYLEIPCITYKTEKSFIAHPWIQRPVVGLECIHWHGQPLQHGEVRDTNLAWVGPVIIIIMQGCSHALSTRKCLKSLSCGGVSNMLLVLSITFHCHYNIRGCIWSTGPFQFRWLKGYIYSPYYHHHQIGSITLTQCYHNFPWLCAWGVCCIMLRLLLHFLSGKTGILFSLLLCSLWWM